MNEQNPKRSIWTALKGWARPSFVNQTVVSSDLDGMRNMFMPIVSPSGFAVTDNTAMQVSTVYACLSKISGAILQLPLNKYRLNTDGDRQQVPRDALWWMLNESPSPAWTASSWKEWIVRCVALRGDQFTEIVRSTSGNSYGDPLSLKIHHPDCVVVRRNPEKPDRLIYDVMDINTLKGYTVDQDDMLHFAGFGFDGLRSLSVIQYAAKTGVGNSLAAADYMGRTIGEGAMPQIALKYPNKMAADQQKLLRDSFVATYGAGTGARKLPLVLTEGADVRELSITAADMQIMELRRFEREDICQALGVPPVMIGENEKTSSWGSGVEQITLGFVKYTIKPHLTRWEEELNRKLFRNAGPYLEFDLDELLRGDSSAQSAAFKSALGGPGSGDAYMTVNEVRRLKNLSPRPGGDVLYKAPAAPDPNAAPPAAPPPTPTKGKK